MITSRNDHDTLGFGNLGFAPMVAELGTVGWEEDDDESYFEQGTDENDGHTLVRIQLYRGRDPATPIRAGVAQGHKILACPAGPLWYIPPRGTQVLVVFPGGMESVPGAGTFFVRGRTPAGQFGPKRVKLEVPTDYDLVLKGQRVTLTDWGNSFVSISPEAGIQFSNANGDVALLREGAFVVTVAQGGDGKTILSMTTSSFDVIQKDGSSMKLADGKWQAVGAQTNLVGGSVGLGMSPAIPVCGGPGGPASVGSKSVWVTP